MSRWPQLAQPRSRTLSPTSVQRTGPVRFCSSCECPRRRSADSCYSTTNVADGTGVIDCFELLSFTLMFNWYVPGVRLASGNDFSTVTWSPVLPQSALFSTDFNTDSLFAVFTTSYSMVADDLLVFWSMLKL